jgi:flavorubredoxin
MRYFKNALVIYYSRSGNTRKAASAISQQLNCDIEEIKSRVTYGMRFFGFQRALAHAILKRKPRIEPLQKNLKDYDLIIVASPVWAGTMAAPVRTFFSKYKKSIKRVAFFLTQGGSYGREDALYQMRQEVGMTPESIFVMSQKDFDQSRFEKEITLFCSDFRKEERETAKKPTSIPMEVTQTKNSSVDRGLRH